MWRVGLLYRACDLLDLLCHKTYHLSALHNTADNYRGVSFNELLKICCSGKWIRIDKHKNIHVTKQGMYLLNLDNPVLRLRWQVQNLSEELNPPWLSICIQGRKAFAQYLPPEALQCFKESGLLDSLEDDVILWWDKLSSRFRSDKNLNKVGIGRKGENLSYHYEYRRTGKFPIWTALEYEGAGYDLLSQVSSEDDKSPLIEVKASNEPWESARFYLTRNEWEVLKLESNSVIHLWSMANHQASLAIISISDILSHIPLDQGSGKWEMAHCTFMPFQACYCLLLD